MQRSKIWKHQSNFCRKKSMKFSIRSSNNLKNSSSRLLMSSKKQSAQHTKTWLITAPTYLSANRDSWSFTKKSKNKEPITCSSVSTKKLQTWRPFSKKKKSITLNNWKTWRVNKKTTEEATQWKFSTLIKTSLKHSPKSNDFKWSSTD